ncbi:MAG: hypothetical protein M3M98_06880 [Nitrospirota bacterium]|nr:hypothetical protein [Nitrospirota bacterium]
MSAIAATVERSTGRVDDQGLLFEYTIKLVLFVGFFELVLYRLVSRLGMHISKIAAQHEWIGTTFQLLTSVGFALLNVVAIFVFLALVVLLLNRMRATGITGIHAITIPSVGLLLILTVAFLIVPPAMLGSIAYNVITLIALTALMIEYVSQHHEWSKRIMSATYYFGISGWLYYQIFSTTYGWMGVIAPPPFVYEAHRVGEALMVLASMLVFWAYGRGISFRTRNRQQRRRAIWFGAVSGLVFLALLFMDYFLGLYNPVMAHSIRKAGEGISWIFQMGMGYTFYLPFAFYVAGLLCWSYTVIRLVTMGRLAGYGLALMFMAGYALLFSSLTLMVILGVMLLTLDRPKGVVMEHAAVTKPPLVGTQDSFVGGQI